MTIVMRDHDVRSLRRAKVTIRPLDLNRSMWVLPGLVPVWRSRNHDGIRRKDGEHPLAGPRSFTLYGGY